VNKYWMCDEGMLDYRRIEENRVEKAYVGKEATTVGAALDKAASALSAVAPERVAVVFSAQHSNEDNYALLALARDVIGTESLFVSGKLDGEGDNILRSIDKNPNTRGVASLTKVNPARSMHDLGSELEASEYSVVLALGTELGGLDALPSSNAQLIVLSTHHGALTERASVLLPASSWAEMDGTYVNVKGFVQESEPAIGPMFDSRPAWKLLAGIAFRLGKDFGWRKIADVQAALAPEKAAPASVSAAVAAGAPST
jgi:NADH-quinone oxidoreductase subunit G